MTHIVRVEKVAYRYPQLDQFDTFPTWKYNVPVFTSMADSPMKMGRMEFAIGHLTLNSGPSSP
jgi:hypothetical protein